MRILRFVPRFQEPEEMLRKYCARNFKTPHSLELVYLPFVLFRYRIVLRSFKGKEKTARGFFLADLVQGVPINIRRDTWLDVCGEIRETDESWGEFGGRCAGSKLRIPVDRLDAAESQILPADLEPESAIQRAKKLLRYDIMRLAGGLRYKDVDIVPEPPVHVLHYPHWLVYVRKKGDVRMEVLDALTGQKERGQLVDSIKLGLVRKHQTSGRMPAKEGSGIEKT